MSCTFLPLLQRLSTAHSVSLSFMLNPAVIFFLSFTFSLLFLLLLFLELVQTCPISQSCWWAVSHHGVHVNTACYPGKFSLFPNTQFLIRLPALLIKTRGTVTCFDGWLKTAGAVIFQIPRIPHELCPLMKQPLTMTAEEVNVRSSV